MFRRAFLKAIGSALIGATLARTLPGIAGEPPILTTPTYETFRPGDVFTIEGKYAFNPVTRQQTDHLQYFMVTAVDGDNMTVIPQGHGV